MRAADALLAELCAEESETSAAIVASCSKATCAEQQKGELHCRVTRNTLHNMSFCLKVIRRFWASWSGTQSRTQSKVCTALYLCKVRQVFSAFCVQAWSRGARSARLHKELQACKINEVVLITLCIVFYMTGKMWKARELVLQSSVPEDELISHQLSFSKITQSANRDLQNESS